MFVYDPRFVDNRLYEQETVQVTEGKRTFEARWRSLSELQQENIVLVPEGLETFL